MEGRKGKGEGRETEVGVGVVGEETRKKRYIYSMAAVKRTSGSNMYVTLHCQIDACKSFN